METDTWKIINYKDENGIIYDNYIISNNGIIKNIKTNKQLEINYEFENSNGRVNLQKKGHKKTIYISKLMIFTFRGEYNTNEYYITYLDGNNKNNNINNLILKKYNIQEQYEFIITFDNNTEVSDNELWKKIIVNNSITKFSVSDHGKFKKENNVIELSLNDSGYYNMEIRVAKNQYKRRLLHRLVAQAFCEIPEKYKHLSYEDLVVDHIDGNKTNNNATNLKWCDKKENNNNINTKQYIQIYQIDKKKYEILTEYNSVDEAAEVNGVNQSAISQALIDFKDMHNSKKRVVESCDSLWCKKNEYDIEKIKEWHINAISAKENNMKNERKRCNLNTDEQKNNKQKLLEREKELDCKIINKDEINNTILNDNTLIKFNCKNNHFNQKEFKLFKTRNCAECSGKKTNTFEKLNNELIPGINLKIISLNPDFKNGNPSTKKKCYVFECIKCKTQYTDTYIDNLRNYIKRNKKYCKCS